MIDAPAVPAAPTKPFRLNPKALKLVCLGALALTTLIPSSMISNLIEEREVSQRIAEAAVARIWGPEQIVSGPTIMVPTETAGGATIYARVAPKTMTADIEIEPQKRHRGFFDTTVYAATVHISGYFALPDTVRTGDGSTYTLPDTGFLAITLRALTGVVSADSGAVAGAKAPWQPFEESKSNCVGLGKVLVVPASLKASRDNLPFEATLHLRGTQSFQIAALAKTMNAKINGAWPTPSYIGDEPPLKTSTANDAFAAQWQIDGIGTPALSSSSCVVDTSGAEPSFGVGLVDAIPIYRMVTRATKYAPLFVVLAFTAYFVFELLTGAAISFVQYALMAASLSLFALLLVALGEFAGYNAAYLASALLVTGQASLFTASVVRRRPLAAAFAALLAGLFGFLYVLLGLETLALLTGTIALFVVLSIVMGVTQRVQRVA